MNIATTNEFCSFLPIANMSEQFIVYYDSDFENDQSFTPYISSSFIIDNDPIILNKTETLNMGEEMFSENIYTYSLLTNQENEKIWEDIEAQFGKWKDRDDIDDNWLEKLRSDSDVRLERIYGE